MASSCRHQHPVPVHPVPSPFYLSQLLPFSSFLGICSALCTLLSNHTLPPPVPHQTQNAHSGYRRKGSPSPPQGRQMRAGCRHSTVEIWLSVLSMGEHLSVLQVIRRLCSHRGQTELLEAKSSTLMFVEGNTLRV